MKKHIKFVFLSNLFIGFWLMTNSAYGAVQVGDLARLEGVRDNALVGYGIVVGLAGTGDSRRSQATLQSVANALQKFGVFIDPSELSARNVASVMVTGTLPAFAEVGNKIDVNVSSMGDARSLSGGTLLLTPLKAVNGEIVGLAQGPVSVGGYNIESFESRVQKNHPTVGSIPGGGVVERATVDKIFKDDRSIALVLNEPNFITNNRIVDALNEKYPGIAAETVHAGKVKMQPGNLEGVNPMAFIASLLQVEIIPDAHSRVVINERTGTVVAGGDIRIEDISITHGNLRIEVQTDFSVSQPSSVLLADSVAVPVSVGNENIRTTVVPQTRISVEEDASSATSLAKGATINDLIGALNKLKLTTRDIIVILQAIHRAGALHGELVIQ